MAGQEVETVYVRNLNERVKLEPLKKALFVAFSQFGEVIDVVARRSVQMRGQAFVVFADPEAARRAANDMGDFPLFDKPMQVALARVRSDVRTKADGTYVKRERVKRPAVPVRAGDDGDELARAKRGRWSEPADDGAAMDADGPAGGHEAPSMPDTAASMAARARGPAALGGPAIAAAPHETLFLQSLPDDVTDMALQMLFQQYPGFKQVRLVPGRKGIAFVDFESPAQSEAALQGLQGFKLSEDHLMQITFAKR